MTTGSAGIAIVGAGASGTLLAGHLLRSSAGTGPVILIERGEACGPGVAYSTTEPAHLLNVPAGRMSAIEDRPDDFVEWLHGEGIQVNPSDFVQREAYGRYLRSVLESAEHGSTRELIRIRGTAAEVRVGAGGATVEVEGAEPTTPVRARRVVLALGNTLPRTPSFLGPILTERYIPDPWEWGALERIGRDESVLLVGTGLTAIDVILSLASRGHTARIEAVSRHGLIPRVHRPPARPNSDLRGLAPVPNPMTAGALLRWARDEMKGAARQGADWRDVMNALRPMTQRLWIQLPADERTIFLRHLSRFWSVHRHRMAPQVGAEIQRLRQGGQLTFDGGDLRAIPRDGSVDVQLTPRDGGPVREFGVSWIVNCTGPELDPSRSSDPLIQSLLEHGSARRDPLGLGLDCTADGRVLDSSGVPSPSLWAIGSLRTGSLWESTAIPEIREQAAHLSGVLDREGMLV
jgi:uncharacterized NAD(P)/FAD-binding protein YdhS